MTTLVTWHCPNCEWTTQVETVEDHRTLVEHWRSHPDAVGKEPQLAIAPRIQVVLHD